MGFGFGAVGKGMKLGGLGWGTAEKQEIANLAHGQRHSSSNHPCGAFVYRAVSGLSLPPITTGPKLLTVALPGQYKGASVECTVWRACVFVCVSPSILSVF